MNSNVDKRPGKLRHRELSKKISRNTRIDKKDTDLMLEALPFALIDELQKEGDKVYIKNLGTFVVKLRKGKIDNLSGKPIKRRDKLVIRFEGARKFIPYSEQDLLDERVN